MTPTRRCPTCGNTYPLTADYFHRNRTSHTGYGSHCKRCRCAYHRTWRMAHKAQISAYNHARYVALYAQQRRKARLEAALEKAGL